MHCSLSTIVEVVSLHQDIHVVIFFFVLFPNSLHTQVRSKSYAHSTEQYNITSSATFYLGRKSERRATNALIRYYTSSFITSDICLLIAANAIAKTCLRQCIWHMHGIPEDSVNVRSLFAPASVY